MALHGKNIKEELLQLPSEEDGHLALWKITSKKITPDKHIFLTHGTFSDRRICKGIASYFAEKGYTCWTMEWRGHGNSSMPKEKFNFETIALKDFPVAFNYLVNTLSINQLNCITHSGGGTCLMMFLVNYQQYISKIKTASLFGCQTTGSANSFTNRLRILMGKYVGATLGYLPATKFGLPHNETHYLMDQWNEWNLKKKFSGKNISDYYAHLPKITFPILSLCGKNDTLIAPPSGCKHFLNAFQNPQNKFLLCSKVNGFKEDYNHRRVFHSSNAKEEIWGIVSDWIEQKHDRS